MPPRYAYWTILASGLPTAFRTSKREELLPTFRQIKQKHPDAEMKWFARGKLWESPDEAQAALAASRGRRAGEQERTRGGKEGAGMARARDWRPGGEHRDPRQRFKDAKKARNQKRRQERFERKEEKREASTSGERKPWAGKKSGAKPEWKRDARRGAKPGGKPGGSTSGSAGRKHGPKPEWKSGRRAAGTTAPGQKGRPAVRPGDRPAGQWRRRDGGKGGGNVNRKGPRPPRRKP